jgi:hypothetical protein
VALANVLAGDEFDPSVFDPADSAECAWAITEALLLSPPDDDDPEPFSPEVRTYVGKVLRDEGYVTPPDVLKIALDGDFAEHVRYSFADDPEMFSGIHDVQAGKTQEIESVIREGLSELLDQLKALPLQHGSVAELEKMMQKILGGGHGGAQGRVPGPAEGRG